MKVLDSGDLDSDDNSLVPITSPPKTPSPLRRGVFTDQRERMRATHKCHVDRHVAAASISHTEDLKPKSKQWKQTRSFFS